MRDLIHPRPDIRHERPDAHPPRPSAHHSAVSPEVGGLYVGEDGHLSLREERAFMPESSVIRSLVLMSFGFVMASGLLACSEETGPDETCDGGPCDAAACDGGSCPGTCPADLPEARVECTAPSCASTTGTKTFAQTELAAATSSKWLIVSWLTSEIFDNETLNVGYTKEIVGGLGTSVGGSAGRSPKERTLDELRTIYASERLRRIEGENLIRSWQQRDSLVGLDSLIGSGIRGLEGKTERSRTSSGSTRAAGDPCSVAQPSCGSTALCVIPTGQTSGSCATQLSMKFPTGPTTFDSFQAVVRRVGTLAAVAVDVADSLSDADVEAIVRRFDEHVGPLEHTFFGEPKNAAGRDRDGNGVVLFVVTSRLAAIADGAIVGSFQPNDLGDPASVPTSNGADLLYLQPLGASITLDNVSATVAHEYQHLINFYAKAINRGVPAGEEIWLDEGISTFAEEIVGYSADAYKNAAAYLKDMGSTSMTGFGLLNNASTADSVERRGMAYLLLRYFYEEKGSAGFQDAPGSVTDRGGVAAIRGLVQSADTGLELFANGKTGRSWHDWVGGMVTAVAVDGADYPGVSCNPRFSFEKPLTVAYTGYPRGLDLRRPAPNFGGGTIPLSGPDLSATFETEEVPLPANGSELRTLQIARGSARISVAGPAEDYILGLRAVPIP